MDSTTNFAPPPLFHSPCAPTMPGFMASPHALCHVFADRGPFWAAGVRGVSTRGIHLIVNHLVPVGKDVDLEIQVVGRPSACRRQARIVCTFQESDGAFGVFGAFSDPLTENELKALQ